MNFCVWRVGPRLEEQFWARVPSKTSHDVIALMGAWADLARGVRVFFSYCMNHGMCALCKCADL